MDLEKKSKIHISFVIEKSDFEKIELPSNSSIKELEHVVAEHISFYSQKLKDGEKPKHIKILDYCIFLVY